MLFAIIEIKSANDKAYLDDLYRTYAKMLTELTSFIVQNKECAEGDIEVDELQTALAQRNALARYIFEQDSGALDAQYCLREMNVGRCPYKDLPYGEDRKAEICAPCIIKMIGKGTSVPSAPYFYLLAEHKVLVTYHVIGGPLAMGRVQSVEYGSITFKLRGRYRRYQIQDIDVIVPQEVLRWNQGGLNAIAWRRGRKI